MSRLSVIDADKLLRDTDGGRTIWEQELGNMPNKPINSPLRTDKNPSFSLFNHEGIWLFKDFAEGSSGNIFTFLMKRYGITYKQALEKVKNNSSLVPVNPQNSLKIAKKEELRIDFIDCPFEDKHRQYWDKYGLDEQFLKENNVFAVSHWGFNDKIRKVQKSRAVFAYFAEDIDKVKILQVGKDVTKQEKWKNTVPNNYLWNFPETKCNQLWVVKSYKDMLCLKKHFNFCATAVQNEDYKILEPNMSRILDISEDVVLCYGSDDMAVKNCRIIQQKYNTKYFNTPKWMLKRNVIDIADCIAYYGVKKVEELLKNKGYL